jgi:hypothetical protein
LAIGSVSGHFGDKSCLKSFPASKLDSAVGQQAFFGHSAQGNSAIVGDRDGEGIHERGHRAVHLRSASLPAEQLLGSGA